MQNAMGIYAPCVDVNQDISYFRAFTRVNRIVRVFGAAVSPAPFPAAFILPLPIGGVWHNVRRRNNNMRRVADLFQNGVDLVLMFGKADASRIAAAMDLSGEDFQLEIEPGIALVILAWQIAAFNFDDTVVTVINGRWQAAAGKWGRVRAWALVASRSANRGYGPLHPGRPYGNTVTNL